MLQTIVNPEMLQRIRFHSTDNRLYIYPRDRNAMAHQSMGADILSILRFFPDEERVRAWWMCKGDRMIGGVMFSLPGDLVLKWMMTAEGLKEPALSLPSSINVPVESEVDLMMMNAEPSALIERLWPHHAAQIIADLNHCGVTITHQLKVAPFQMVQNFEVIPLAA